MKIRKNYHQFVLFGILCFFTLLMSVFVENFFTLTNISNIFRQQSMVAIAAAGATFVMITKGLDISVGSNLALSGVVFALYVQRGGNIFVGLLLAVLCGAMVGLINGLLVEKARLNAVIATLGTMYAIRGVAYLVSDGKAIVSGLPPSFVDIGRGFIGIIPLPVVIMAVVYILFHFVLSRTLLGKYTYAIGGNRETAYLSGLPTRNVMITLFTITGALTGLSGVIMASRLGSGNPQIGQGFEFDVIIAVFLGGVSTSGGEGTMVGTLIGIMIVGVLSNGLNLLGVNPFFQYVIKGVILVVAVIVDMRLKGEGVASRKRGESVRG
ncbi:MAG: ABC transporter permease [Rectinemataceae bacterium]